MDKSSRFSLPLSLIIALSTPSILPIFLLFLQCFCYITQMLEKMKKLQYQEWVGLPTAHEENQAIAHRAPFRDLLALENARQRNYICQHGTFKLEDVLKIMPKEKREEQKHESHVYVVNNNISVGENQINNTHGDGNQINNASGDKTVITQQVQTQIQELDNKLKELQFAIKTDIEDESLRKQSLAELRAIREALENIQKTDKVEQKEAQETLETFYERMKNGGSNLMNSLTYLRDSSETTQWVHDHITNLMTTLNSWIN